jgi:signal transduction histidine kinase
MLLFLNFNTVKQLVMFKYFILLFVFYATNVLSQKDTLKILKLIDDAGTLEVSNPRASLKLYDEAYRLSIKINYLNGAYKSLFFSGFPYSNIGLYDSTLYRFNKTIAYCKKNNIEIGIAKANANIANTYQYKGEYTKAVKYYINAIKSFEKLKDSSSTAISYQNLAAIYTQYKNEKLEFFYLKKAEQFFKKNDFMNKGLLYSDIGLGYLRYDKFTEALTYFKKAERLLEKTDNKELKFYVVRNFGEYYRLSKNYQKAISYYNSALKLADNSIDIVRKCDLLYITSEVHLQVKNYTKAIELASQSLEISKKIKSKELEYKSLKKLSSAYNKINLPQKAFDALEKSYLIKDSVFSDEHLKETALLQTQFETEKKDKSIAKQQVQLKKQELDLIKSQKEKQLYFTVSMTLILIIIGIWYFFKQRQKYKNKEIIALHQQQEISKLEALIDGEENERRRIAQDLHDGLNGDLSAIKYRLSTLEESGLSAIDSENLIKVINMIDDSCAQVRSISHNLMPTSIIDFGLVETIEQYCAKINSSQSIDFDFQYFGTVIVLPKKVETVIYRIVQELINNTVKHSAATKAMVQMNYHEKELFITVEDNGIGFDTTTKKNGIGLKNVASRVDFLKANLEIESTEKGTSFNIIIDLKKI